MTWWVKVLLAVLALVTFVASILASGYTGPRE